MGVEGQRKEGRTEEEREDIITIGGEGRKKVTEFGSADHTRGETAIRVTHIGGFTMGGE